MEKDNKTASSKIFLAITVLVTIYCFIAAFFELPPAHLLIRYYCQVFDANKYPVTLIFLVLLFICIIPLGIINKIIEHKRKN